MRSLPCIGVLLFAVLPACEELPRDPGRTLSKVRAGSLTVGVIERRPWTRYEDEGVAGVEVELVEALAEELGADVTWVRGGESELMPALTRFELDLVIGGMTKGSPWASTGRVGLSRSYYTTRYTVAVPADRQLADLRGQRVAVQQGSPLAAMVRDRGGEPVRVPTIRETDIEAVVAPTWQIEQLGRVSTGIELHRERHAMAIPPGENGWLMHIDRFLERESGDIRAMLQRAERGR